MIRLTCMFVCFIVISTMMYAHARNEDKYSSKYDDIDVDAVLVNPRLRTQYVNCVLDISPCNTGSARFLKDRFAEAYITRCKKCTEKQIEFFNKITEWFTTNDIETWNRLLQKTLKS